MTDSNFTDGTTGVPGTDVSDANAAGLHPENIPGYDEGTTPPDTYPVDPAYAAAYPADGQVPPPVTFGGPDLGEVTHLLHEINNKLSYQQDCAAQEHEHSAAGHDPIYDVLNVLWDISYKLDHQHQHDHGDTNATDPVLDALTRIEDKLNRTFNS